MRRGWVLWLFWLFVALLLFSLQRLYLSYEMLLAISPGGDYMIRRIEREWQQAPFWQSFLEWSLPILWLWLLAVALTPFTRVDKEALAEGRRSMCDRLFFWLLFGVALFSPFVLTLYYGFRIALGVFPSFELFFYTVGYTGQLASEVLPTLKRMPGSILLSLGGFYLLVLPTLLWLSRAVPLRFAAPRWRDFLRTGWGVAYALFAFVLLLVFPPLWQSGHLRLALAGALAAPFVSPQIEAAVAADSVRPDLPPTDLLPPALYDAEGHFRRRYGFTLPEGSDLVVLMLEASRSEYVDLSRTRFFSPGDRQVLAAEGIYVPIPHSSNSHYTLLTGHVSARRAHRNFAAIDSERTLSGKLAARGYRTLFLYGGDITFDREHLLFAAAGMEVVDEQQLKRRVDPRTGQPWSTFEWGVDDYALYDFVEESLAEAAADGDDRPLFLWLAYTNAHIPYFNPDPESYNRFDNRERLGRHRNAIDYALDISDQIVELFERHGRHNTLFVLVADHGESFGERGFWVHDFSLYNSETFVPLAMRHPLFDRLDDIDALPIGSLPDLTATIYDLYGIDFRRQHGRSLFATDFRLMMPLLAWGSDDYRGYLYGDTKWIHWRREDRLYRLTLDESEEELLEIGAEARHWLSRLYALESLYGRDLPD